MVPKGSGFIRLALAGEAGLFLLAWALGRGLGISPLTEIQPSLGAFLWGVIATVPLGLGLAWMLTTSWSPIRRLVALVTEQIGPALAGCSAVELALLAVAAGVSEEVLFRGVVQIGLVRAVPAWLALIMASTAFGLVHFASRAYAAVAGVIGIYLGTLLLVQGSLLAPIVTHALYDFVALLYVARRRTA
jgi:membrane protease YdiL (CAAX protease family)